MELSNLDQHMNLFHFYSETKEPKYIENNITRALALCISQDRLFQYSFLESILNPDDFRSLFYTYQDGANIDVNLQVETASIVQDTRILYAVGLTDVPEPDNWDDLASSPLPAEGRNVTDMVITINDIKIILEVKRTNENCKEQLRRQIAPFLETGNDSHDESTDVVPKHINWASILTMMEKVKNFYMFNGEQSFFISSFIAHIQQRFGHWIPTKPFKYQRFFTNKGDKIARLELDKRLLQAMHSIEGGSIREFWDRTAIVINKSWASEAIPEFMLDNKGEPYLAMRVWPGNTKGQGYGIYNKPLSWVNNESIQVDGNKYELIIERHIKFMHFNKYITSIDTPVKDDETYFKKIINTPDNHYHNIAGKWNRQYWSDLEKELDDHYKVDWRKIGRCKYVEEFINSDRSYLTIALGFTINMYIPFTTLQNIDDSEQGYKALGEFLVSCKDAIVDMVENN